MYSDDELLRRMKMLTWDTTLTSERLLAILKGESGSDKSVQKGLYIKILNWFPWHEVRCMIPENRLPDVLADDVIQGLFPRDLRDKYRYVKSLL